MSRAISSHTHRSFDRPRMRGYIVARIFGGLLATLLLSPVAAGAAHAQDVANPEGDASAPMSILPETGAQAPPAKRRSKDTHASKVEKNRAAASNAAKQPQSEEARRAGVAPIALQARPATQWFATRWDILGFPVREGSGGPVYQERLPKELLKSAVPALSTGFKLGPLTDGASASFSDAPVTHETSDQKNGEQVSSNAEPEVQLQGETEYYAGLVEERPEKPEFPKIQIGTVTWLPKSDPSNASASAQVSDSSWVPIARVSVAAANLGAEISICCRGTEASPVSRLSLDVRILSQSSRDPISGIEGLRVRQTGNVQGDPLSARISSDAPNLFQILLSEPQSELGRNTRLLLSRPWIDIPLIFASGRKATLTIAMGKVGSDTIDRALGVWHGP